eukprot:TRINITY_DN3769_c0_g1_i1.p1 TRINITY_DN3769_c0_g1~~TRINITY_DN3769_c0_g1_i1.p1  ORF type:complete len:229 (+),score=54.34 TRINITY_DN3769_c0_g1_i1:58-687(+)
MSNQIFQLEFKLIGASDIPAADFGGTSDPYCFITVGNVRAQSSTCPSTLNPVWNQTFTFIVPPSETKVLVELYDEDNIGDDEKLGTAEVPLTGSLNQPESENTYPFKGADGSSKGTVKCGVKYSATGNQQARIDELTAENAQLKADLEEIQKKFEETAEILKGIKGNGSELSKVIAETEKINSICDICTSRNIYYYFCSCTFSESKGEG